MKKIIASVLLVTVLSSSAVMCFANAQSEGVSRISRVCFVDVDYQKNERAKTPDEELVLVKEHEIKEQGGYKKTSWDQLTKCDKKAVLKLIDATIKAMDPSAKKAKIGWEKFRAGGLALWLKIRGVDLESLDIGDVELMIFDVESGEVRVNWDAAK